jgi:hypothetical protein
MEYGDLQRLMDPIEVKYLTEHNFQNFCNNAAELFLQENAKFQNYFSPGYGIVNSKLLDSKPGWTYKNELTLRDFGKGKNHLTVTFNEDPFSAIIGYVEPFIPFSFGFNNDKAMYLAHEEDHENKISLWEDLYIKY